MIMLNKNVNNSTNYSIANITKVVVLYKGSAQPEIHDEGGQIEAKIYIVWSE